MTAIVAAKYFFILTANCMLLGAMLSSVSKIKKTALMPLIAFMLVLLHSIFFSSDIPESIERALFSLLFVSAFTLMIARFPVLSISWLEKFLYISGILWVVFSLVAMVGFPSLSYSSGNFRGFTNNSNYFAMYLAIFVVPSFFQKVVRARKWSKVFWINLIFLSLLLFILFETRSRAAILVVLFVFSIAFHYLKVSKSTGGFRGYLKTGGFLLVSLLILLNADFMTNKYSFEVDDRSVVETTFATRTILYEYRLQGISEKPWTGWGYSINSMEGRMTEPWVFNNYEKGTTPLAIVEEFGVIFGAVCLVFLFKIGLSSFRQWPNNSIVCSIVVGGLFHSIFETWLFNFNSYYCWIFWFCVVQMLANESNPKELPNRSSSV